MALHNFYNYRNNTILGIKPVHILLSAVGIVVLLWLYVQNKTADAVKGVTAFFGDSDSVKRQIALQVESDKKQVESVRKSYGEPSALEYMIANQLYNAMNSIFGDDASVIKIFGEITGKWQMNRVYIAFDQKIIYYGLGLIKKREGNLLTHISNSNIDIDKLHKRKNGTSYNLRTMINLIDNVNK